MVEATADPSSVVDHRALAVFLGDCLPSANEVAVTVLAGGSSNLTLLLRVDGDSYVLRRRPLGESAARAHDMNREFTAISALNSTDFPVPRAIRYSEDLSIVGAPFYLMQFVDGITFHSVRDAEQLDADTTARMSEDLVRTLAALHALDPVRLGLGQFGRSQQFLQRRIVSWLRQWRSVRHRNFSAVELLGERLLGSVPDDAGTALVHGDYRLGNVLFDAARGMRLTAVLDWEMSTIGDPLTDLAHLLVYWEPTRGRVTHPSQLIAQRNGFWDGRQLVARYGEITGRDTSDLTYYLAFEHWRAAVIKDAIFLRANHDGAQLSATMRDLGDSVQAHLDEALDLLADRSDP